MNRERYSDRAKRDARARELSRQGYRVRRYSTRNQLIHPMYLEDLKDTPAAHSIYAYKTPFAAVYTVEWTSN